ncbi:hypothetical protein I546_3545 [Mycobacterium kansasii 732]|nr:hypothetical protein I546_3545 [Mycobacterium kansasii 732]
MALAALAILTSGMGLLRWRQADRAMRRGRPLPRHPTPAYLAVGLAVVGIVALGLVIVKAVRVEPAGGDRRDIGSRPAGGTDDAGLDQDVVRIAGQRRVAHT